MIEHLKEGGENKKSQRAQEVAKIEAELHAVILADYRNMLRLSGDKLSEYFEGKDLKMSDVLYKYFLDKHGKDLADVIDFEKFSLTFANLEKKGYRFDELTDRAVSSHDRLKPETNADEQDVIDMSLSNLQTYFSKQAKRTPAFANVMQDFRKYAKLATQGEDFLKMYSTIKNVEDIYRIWQAFLKSTMGTKYSAKLSKEHKKETERMLRYEPMENFDMTEKFIMQVLVTKISKSLNGEVKKFFDSDSRFARFDALSSVKHFVDFKTQWENFVQQYGPLDKESQKKLGDIFVSFGDVKTELVVRGIAKSKSLDGQYAKWDTKFRTMFGKMFLDKAVDDASKLNEFSESNLVYVDKALSGFPTSFSQFTLLYPYQELNFSADKQCQDAVSEITELRAQLKDPSLDKDARKDLEQKLFDAEEKFKHRKWQLYAEYVAKQEPKLDAVMQALIANGFDFVALDKVHHQTLLNVMTEKHAEFLKSNALLASMGIDVKELEETMKSLVDFDSDELVVQTPDGAVSLQIAKDQNGRVQKTIVGTKDEGLTKVEEFSKQSGVELEVRFEANKENVEFFENSVLWKNNFYEVQGQKLAPSYKTKIVSKKTGKVWEGYPFVLSKGVDEKVESGKDDRVYFFEHEVTEKTIGDAKPLLDESGNPLSVAREEDDEYDEYEISVDDKDKQIVMSGDRLNSLLLGDMIGHAEHGELETETENEQELLSGLMPNDEPENVIPPEGENDENPENAQNPENAENNAAVQEAPSRDNEQVNQTPEVNEAAEFKQFFDSIPGYHGDFETGISFVGRLSESKIAGGGGRWVEVKVIADRGDHFRVRMSGCDTKLSSQFEGREHDFPKNKETLEHWKSSFSGNFFKIWPQGRGKDAFYRQIADLKKSGVKLAGLQTFEQSVEYNGSDFLLKDEAVGKPGEKITYFASTDLKCEVLPSRNGYFTVNMNFNGTDKDGAEVEYTYTKQMSPYQFLLFMGEKGLMPVTKAEKEAQEQQEQENGVGNGPVWARRKWYSLRSVWGFFKNIGKNIKEKWDKSKEEELADLTDWWAGENGMYRRLAHFLPGRMGEALEDMDAQYMEKRDGMLKEKIETWRNAIKNTPERRNGENRYSIHVAPMLQNGEKDRFKIAGAMLAMLDKGGLYQKGDVDFGGWVKLMFGDDAHRRFINLYAAKKKELMQLRMMNKGGTVEPLNEELMKLEVQYISDQLTNGGHAISKDYYLQQSHLWSKWFGDELMNGFNKVVGKGSFNEQFEAIGNVTFEYAEAQFEDAIDSGKPQEAMPFLKKMFVVAKSPHHQERICMHMMGLGLGGVYNNFVDIDTRKAFQKLARSTHFTPMIWVRDVEHQKWFKTIANSATDNAFDAFMSANGFKDSDFTFPSAKKAGDFVKAFSKWWKSNGNGARVMSFVNSADTSLFAREDAGNLNIQEANVLSELKKQRLEGAPEDMDPDVSLVPPIFLQQPFNASKTFVRSCMNIGNGVFTGASGEQSRSQAFWDKVVDVVPKYNLGDQKSKIVHVAQKFFNFFDSLTIKTFVKSLATVQQLLATGNLADKARAHTTLKYMIKGHFLERFHSKLPDEFGKALNAFTDFFLSNMEHFSPEMFLAIAGKEGQKAFEKPYKLMDMKEFAALQDWRHGLDVDLTDDQKRRRKEYGEQDSLNPFLYNLSTGLVRNSLLEELEE